MAEGNELDFSTGVVVTRDMERMIEDTQSPGKIIPSADSGYVSPLETLMGGNRDTEKEPNDGAPDYNIKLIESVVNRIVKMSSVFKVEVLNLDKGDARAIYANLQNKPNIKILSEEGNFCIFEVSSQDERTKDAYYKVVVKYREVDYEKLIAGFEKACRSAVIGHEVAIGLLCKSFYELEARSEELMTRLSKASEEGLAALKEERARRKAELGEQARKIREKKAQEDKDAQEMANKPPTPNEGAEKND